jgi:hypothetical protein
MKDLPFFCGADIINQLLLTLAPYSVLDDPIFRAGGVIGLLGTAGRRGRRPLRVQGFQED